MWFNLRRPNNIWGWRQNMLRYQMSNYKLQNVPEVLSKSCHRACFYCSQVAWPWTSFLGYSAIESHFICKLVWYGVFITQGPRSQQTCPRLRHATWHFLSVGCSARWSFYRLNKRRLEIIHVQFCKRTGGRKNNKRYNEKYLNLGYLELSYKTLQLSPDVSFRNVKRRQRYFPLKRRKKNCWCIVV